jgi:hypothetical protein
MNATTRLLLHYHNEIEQLKSSVLGQFNNAKINQFMRDNGIRIQTAYRKIEDLKKEFLEMDANGNVKTEGEGENIKPLFKEGKTKEDFDRAYNNLMDSETIIKF